MTQARDLADGKFDTSTLVVDAANNRVGIGTASPSEPFHIVGASGAATDMQIQGGDDTNSVRLFMGGDTNPLNGRIVYSTASDFMAFSTGGDQRIRVDSHGLKFGSDTAAANALDDYEEGTHVATVTGSNSGSATLNSSYNTLAYTKIGQIVHVTGLLIATSIASGSGYIKITLPFNVNGGYTARTAHPSLVNSSDVNVRDFVGITVQGEGFLRLYLGDGTALQDDSFQTLNANSSDIYVNVTYHT